MNIKKFIKDVRGAALVYVIVAAAIIVLLGAATTATAYVNLRATQIQEQSDNNFYQADAVMNAILGGLKQDVSEAYDIAYTYIITNINTYPNAKAAQDEFGTRFLNALDGLLNDDVVNGGDSFKWAYKTEHLQRHVERILKDDIRYTISALNGDAFLDRTEDGIVLRNLHVTYENDNGYFDEITTDVRISIPQFPADKTIKPIEVPGFVIDDGLEMGDGESDVLLQNLGLTINGNAYINERESDKSALLLRYNMALTISAPDEVVLGGYIEADSYSTLRIKPFETESKNMFNVWTENIEVGVSNTVELMGIIHVYDDLELNGADSAVTLNGKYYGYGNGNTAATSSAININGAASKLDISALDAMVLAGTAFVNTSSVPPVEGESNDGTHVQTGEALSVKSNQIAYLVDDNEFNLYIAPELTGDPLIDAAAQDTVINKFEWEMEDPVTGRITIQRFSNPMSYDVYDSMIKTPSFDQASVENLILDAQLSYKKTNNSCWTYRDFGAEVVTVFSQEDNGTVYFYLNFRDPSDAATYFTTVFQGSTLMSQRLRTYAAQYIKELTVKGYGEEDNVYLTIGDNYINHFVGVYTDASLPSDLEGLGYTKPDADAQDSVNTSIVNQANSIYQQYFDNGLVAGNGEKYKVMYEKMINPSQVVKFITEATKAAEDDAGITYNTNITITKVAADFEGVEIKGTTNAKAVVVDNYEKGRYIIEDGVGLIIATGDVEIRGNWLGAIIVGGRAYCTAGTTLMPIDLTYDETVVNAVTSLYFSTVNDEGDREYMSVANIFLNHESAMVNTATTNNGIHEDEISKCITFSNWNRY